MNITKKDLGKSQFELTVEMTIEEFRPYIIRGAEKISRDMKIEGFRPGKAPYEILKNKIGEMAILEEGARLAINKTIDKVINDNVTGKMVGQPQVNITKLAPDNFLEFKITLALLPEIKLCDYKNLKIKQPPVSVSAEEIDKLIEELIEFRASEVISESPVKSGDKVIVDIEMFLDRVPLEQGTAKDTGIIAGKNYIVPGFDKKIIGAKKGDTREFNLIYPEDHHEANLAGKAVDFKVKIKDVYNRILPQINDEFTKNFGLNSLAELKENIKKSLLGEKEEKERQKSELAVLDKIIESSKFGDLPEILVSHESEVMMSELRYGVEKQGGKFDDYLSHLKKTKEQIMLDFMPEAVKRVKVSLALYQIAKNEKIEITEKELSQAIDELIKQYPGDSIITKRATQSEYKAYLANNLVSKKVINQLAEWNVEGEKK